METGLQLASLADDLSKLGTSPDKFSSFYRRLMALQFPLDVAVVLELRYLFNQTIDKLRDNFEGDVSNARAFTDARRADIELAGVRKAEHVERLLPLLSLLRDHHLRHCIASRNTESALRSSLAANARAQHQSRRYAKLSLIALGVATLVVLALAAGGLAPKLILLALAYLSFDYAYSLSILKREQRILERRLSEALDRHVRALDWRCLTRNIALILGYARDSKIETFLLDSDVDTLQPVLFS